MKIEKEQLTPAAATALAPWREKVGRGGFFRSLHLGNIVLLPDGSVGLIDFCDLRILHGALSARMRQRNVRHMLRDLAERH